jgi:hypothetical protein
MKKQTTPVNKHQKKIDILIKIILILSIAVAIFFFAIRPMINKDYYFDSTPEYTFNNLGLISEENSYDVTIIGDSLDGISAAIGSARVGAKTLLVCSSKELGNEINKTYNLNWSTDTSPTGTNVSSDFFKEIRHNAGEGFNIGNYIKAINTMISDEKMLTVLYDAQLTTVTFENGTVSYVNFKIGQDEKIIKSKRYIDATKDGDLLRKCNVAYSSGYSDIGIEGLYPPIKLSFMVNGVDYALLEDMMKKQGTMISSLIKSYRVTDKDISISGLNISDQGDSKVIIQSITVGNVDLSDEKQVEKAYSKASKECVDFYNYLKLNIDQFKNASGVIVADEFYMPSAYHFKGSYSLTLTDVLIGKRFSDRVSTGSRPVTLSLDDGNGYILCNPKIFYMPLRSLIPEGIDNVLMTGDKVSCSPLVQNAIGSNSSITSTGYAAGIIAAYSISKNMEIPQIVEDHNLDVQLEIERTLRKLGIFMSDVKEEFSGLTDNWSYPYIEKLNNLGLLSAGVTNDFKLVKEAKSEDFAYILLNGVPRTLKSAYNYTFDITIRQYVKNEPLTKELFAKILLEMDGKESTTQNYYSEACKQGLIDQTLQLKLKNKNVLQYPEVYYAAVQFIEKKTGKTLK